MTGRPTDIASVVGFSVRGRNGALGIVVGAGRGRGPAAPEPELVVVGGRSFLLRFHIPVSHVSRSSPEEGLLDVDVDVSDFRAELAEDGAVELRVIA